MTKRRRVTMKDVAESLGISISTVSLALRSDSRISEPVQQKVRETAERLGYRLNLSGAILSQSRPKIIGVVADFEQELHAKYVREIARISRKSTYGLISENTSLYEEPVDALKKLSQFQLDTVIAIDPPQGFYCDEITPAVVVAQGTDIPGANLVTSDSVGAAGELAGHLKELGHRTVVFMDGPDGISGEARRKILMNAFAQENIELRVFKAGKTLESGFQAGQNFLSSAWSGELRSKDRAFENRRGPLGDVTAIVCYNDQCAQGVYIALLKAGLSVPSDISLAGFDNSEIGAGRAFGLTSIDRNPFEVAKLAFDAACLWQQGELDAPVRRSAPSFLVVRGSTGEANYLKY